MIKELLRSLSEMPLDDLAPIMELIAKKIELNRSANKGTVPLSIFPYCLSIGGVYPCVEIVPCVGKAFALKKRNASTGEQGWDGLYHVPGVCARITDTPETIINRIITEMFGVETSAVPASSLTLIGVEMHHEPERGAVC